MKACPKCNSPIRNTVRRKPIIKLIPGSKSYACSSCNTKYTWFRYIKKSILI